MIAQAAIVPPQRHRKTMKKLIVIAMSAALAGAGFNALAQAPAATPATPAAPMKAEPAKPAQPVKKAKAKAKAKGKAKAKAAAKK
ncbi:MAG: hypothetical protein AB7F95_02465 [Burkholderiales bacterium]